VKVKSKTKKGDFIGLIQELADDFGIKNPEDAIAVNIRSDELDIWLKNGK